MFILLEVVASEDVQMFSQICKLLEKDNKIVALVFELGCQMTLLSGMTAFIKLVCLFFSHDVSTHFDSAMTIRFLTLLRQKNSQKSEEILNIANQIKTSQSYPDPRNIKALVDFTEAQSNLITVLIMKSVVRKDTLESTHWAVLLNIFHNALSTFSLATEFRICELSLFPNFLNSLIKFVYFSSTISTNFNIAILGSSLFRTLCQLLPLRTLDLTSNSRSLFFLCLFFGYTHAAQSKFKPFLNVIENFYTLLDLFLEKEAEKDEISHEICPLIKLVRNIIDDDPHAVIHFTRFDKIFQKLFQKIKKNRHFSDFDEFFEENNVPEFTDNINSTSHLIMMRNDLSYLSKIYTVKDEARTQESVKGLASRAAPIEYFPEDPLEDKCFDGEVSYFPSDEPSKPKSDGIRIDRPDQRGPKLTDKLQVLYSDLLTRQYPF